MNQSRAALWWSAIQATLMAVRLGGGTSCVIEESKNLVAKLIDNGYTNVIEFHGGEREWKAQGFDLEAYVG